MVLMDPALGGKSPPRITTDSYKLQQLTQNTVCPRSLDATRLQARPVVEGSLKHNPDETENNDVGTDSEHPVVLLDGTGVRSMHKIGDCDAIYIYATSVNSSQETATLDADQDGRCQGNLNSGLMRQSKDGQASQENTTGKVVKDEGLMDPLAENKASYWYDGADDSPFAISLLSDGLSGRSGGGRDKVADTVASAEAAGKEAVGGVSWPVVSSDELVIDEERESGEVVNADTADSVGSDSEVDGMVQLEGKVLQNHGTVDCVQTVSTDGSPSQLAKKVPKNSSVLNGSVDLKSADQEVIQDVSQDSHNQLYDPKDEIDEFAKGSNISSRYPSSSQDFHDDTAADVSMESQDDSDDEGVVQENSSAPCNSIATVSTNGTDGCNSSTVKNKNRIHHISSSGTSQDCTKESSVQNAESLKTGQGQDMALCHDRDRGPESEASSREAVDDSVKVCDENAPETDNFMPVVIKIEPDMSVNEILCDTKDWSPFNGRRQKFKEEEIESPLPAKRIKKNLKSHVNQLRICSTRSGHALIPATKSVSESYSCKVCEKYFSKEAKLNMHLKLHNQNGELQCATCNKNFKLVARFKSHECKSSIYFECGICEKVFSERDKLKDHVDNHREIPEITFERGVRELTFTETISLNVHLQTHKGKKRFQCRQCAKTFTSLKCLKNHCRKKHRTTYKCNICFKQFGKQINLDAHSKLHVRRQRFGCKKCGKRFSRLIDMRIHLKTHKRWKCRSCGEYFETRTELINHKVVHETMYECANCNFTCISESVIKTHMMSHEETRSFTCTECDKSYKSLKWLQNHCQKSHGKEYKCDICSEEFEDVASLSGHSKISEDNFKCETCGQRFDTNKHLKKHMKIHKTWKCRRCDIDFETQEELKIHRDQHKRPFRCVACDFASKTASELKKHMQGHDDINEFICKICDKTFMTATALYNHQLTHINLKKFTCEYCGSGFTHRSTLIIHKRVHTGERPYPCTVCDKTFIEKSALRSHMISHSSERKHKCELCGKTFPHKCSLVRHQRIHNEEKPFQCEQCKKTFGQSTQLKRHKRTHTGEKPYKCEDCGLRFGYVETLRSHRRIHNDITIYCKLCDKSFSTTVHLKRHMKTHTGEVDFVCDVCGEGFIRKDYFMKHVKSHEKTSDEGTSQ